MRNRSSSVLGMILLAASAAAQQPVTAPKADEKPASVEGVVLHALTGEPILRAHVSCDGIIAGKPRQFGAVTNTEGKFSITGLPAGYYRLRAERVGFLMAVDGGRREVDATLRPGDAKSDIKLKLTPTGAILGRVVDSEGNPVEGVSVAAETGGNSASFTSATTDEKGQYRLGGLAPGRYRVRASAGSLPFPPEIRSDGSEELHHVPTYHPGAVEEKGATRVAVRSGADVGGVDVKLQRWPIVQVRGVVTGIPAGVSPESVHVEVRGANRGTRSMSAVNAEGKFEVLNVDPGKWLVSAVLNARTQVVRSAAVEIEVTQQNLDNLELRMMAPFEVTGQVMFENDSAKPTATSRSQRMALQEVNHMGAAGPVTPSADGAFTFANVQPGKYRIVTGWAASIKSVRLGEKEIEGNLVDLTNGSGGAPLVVVLGPASAEVSGTVTDQKGPVAGVTVMLANRGFTTSTSNAVFTTKTAADGTFRMAGIPSAEYVLFAVDEGDSNLVSGNYEDYEDVLVEVDVRSGDKIVKELKRHSPDR